MEAAVTRKTSMKRIMMMRRMTMTMRTIVHLPDTRNMVKTRILTRTMMKRTMRMMKKIIVHIRGMMIMKTRKTTRMTTVNIAAGARRMSMVLPAGAVPADRPAIVVPATVVVQATVEVREIVVVQEIVADLQVAAPTAEEVLHLWIVSSAAASAAKAGVLIMKKGVIMGMTSAVAEVVVAVPAAAGLPADGPAAAAAVVHPATAAVETLLPAVGAAALPAAEVIPVSSAIQAVSSPAAADVPDMAAGAAAADVPLPVDVQAAAVTADVPLPVDVQAAAVTVDVPLPVDAQAAAAAAVQAAAVPATAAAPAGDRRYDSFHKNKQIGPVKTLFVCLTKNIKTACYETSIHRPPQQRTKIEEQQSEETGKCR
jgi:hypothetical protein